MFEIKTCPLYEKLSRGGSLSKSEKKLLADIVMEEEIYLVNIKIDLKRENESFLKKVEAQQKVISELKSKLEKVEAEANLDPLTSLFNRRSLERALEEFFTLCKQSKMSFSLVLIDLDDFKYVNDNYGHHVGDLVLAKVAKVLRTNMGAKDIVGRWGGDEFVVIMPNTDLENAKKVLERIKFQIEKMEILAEGKRFKVSISASVVQCVENFQSWLDMIKEADRIMYEDKKKTVL